MSHSQASVLFFISNNWLAAHLVAVGAPQLLWDMLGHHSLGIILYFPSNWSTEFLNFQLHDCSTHCATKPNICASFHRERKLSHFPRIYSFSQRCLPTVKGVFAKSHKMQLGQTPWVLRTLRGKAGGAEAGWTFFKPQLSVRHYMEYLANLLAFLAGLWGRHIYSHLPDEKQG